MKTGELGSLSGQFLSPVLFVDGHAKFHDFTHALKDDPQYPFEPTADWMWYKPADEATEGSGSSPQVRGCR